jgi:uncharacterized glyoxalase superfamily protein PhnB/AcrR family transcriptional regulator
MGAQFPAGGGARAGRYRSLRREQQARATRARIVAAAARRFLARGYAGTTMRAVAADAGVALPTVELVFGTKARLLKAVIDVAIAGDDEPVPMLDRQWAARARSAAGAAGFAAACAGQLAESAQRAAGLTLVALEAARVDTGIAAVAAQLMAQRQVMAAWMVDGLLRRAPRRAGMDYATAVDTVWALMDPALFCRLTGDRGWSPARFQDWFADALLRLLLPGTGQQPATANQSPEGHMTSIQPELWVDRAAQAVAFYQAAFGATVLYQVGDGEDIVAQLAIGDAAFWVATAGSAGPRRNPNAIGGSTSRTLLVVDDPDAVFGQAVTAGATPDAQPGNEHGWRVARITDPFGHHWEIGRPLGTWPPP